MFVGYGVGVCIERVVVGHIVDAMQGEVVESVEIVCEDIAWL